MLNASTSSVGSVVFTTLAMLSLEPQHPDLGHMVRMLLSCDVCVLTDSHCDYSFVGAHRWLLTEIAGIRPQQVPADKVNVRARN